MTTAPTGTRNLLAIIRAEFDEMPDMLLTRAQFQRLWTLSLEESDDLLDQLLRCGFLVRGHQDRIRRRDS